jgi:vancomycin permeability regulator SanA
VRVEPPDDVGVFSDSDADSDADFAMAAHYGATTVAVMPPPAAPLTALPAADPTMTGPRPRRRWPRRVVLALIAFGGLSLLVVAGANTWVLRSGGPRYDRVEDVPVRPVAVVFGAGIDGDRPSAALAGRLDAAVALYQAGTVPHLLVTGDNHVADHDEVTVMRTYLIDHGVPANAITRDYAGFDTYDSCARAHDVFGVRSAVLVAQDYHLARALFTCQKLGIDAIGLAVPDWQHHPDQVGFTWPASMQRNLTVREWGARLKAVIDTEVLHPGPTLGGPDVGLTET